MDPPWTARLHDQALHLANDWLAEEYLRAAEATEAQATPSAAAAVAE